MKISYRLDDYHQTNSVNQNANTASALKSLHRLKLEQCIQYKLIGTFLKTKAHLTSKTSSSCTDIIALQTAQPLFVQLHYVE